MEINNAINSLSQLTSAMEQEKANFNEQLETVQSQLVSTCDQMAKDEALITKLCDEISRL